MARPEAGMISDGVSVVIPLFNKEAYIGEALKSVTRYDGGPLEVVVINDGSTDRGSDVVRRFPDKRIRLIEQPNMGLSTSRNIGVRNASYDLVALLDADDWWYDGHLENLMRMQASFPQVELFSNNFTRFGRPAYRRGFYKSDPWCLSSAEFLDLMVRATPMNASSVLLRRHAVEAVGGFPTTVRHGEDYAMFVKLGLRSGAVLSPFVGSHYRYVEGSMSGGRIWAPGGGMRAVSELVRGDGGLAGPTKQTLRAIRARWALEYCSGALRRGHNTTARRFLALAGDARGQHLARLIRTIFAHLPVPIARSAMTFMDLFRGRRGITRLAGARSRT